MRTASNNAIARAIYLTAKDRVTPHQIVEFLARKRLLGRSKVILDELHKVVNDEAGVLEAKVWSTKKLSTHDKHDLKEHLVKRYKAKELHFEEVVDENLLGGVRVQVKDEVIDLSLRNQLRELQEHLTKAA